MFGSKKKKSDDSLAVKVSLEVEQHKNRSLQARQRASQATEKLRDTITDNGFTITVHAAAGGKH